jgi:hypothetical protein
MSGMLPINGTFDRGAFVYGRAPSARIGKFDEGLLGWIKHLFGWSVYLDVAESGKAHRRIYVPISEVVKLFPKLQAHKGLHGIGNSFIAEIKAASAVVRGQGPASPKAVDVDHPFTIPQSCDPLMRELEGLIYQGTEGNLRKDGWIKEPYASADEFKNALEDIQNIHRTYPRNILDPNADRADELVAQIIQLIQPK